QSLCMRRGVFIGWQWKITFAAIVCAFPNLSQAAEPPVPEQSLQTKQEVVTPLTTAEQIHRLTREEAARAYRGVTRGVVTCSLPQAEAAVIQDSTRGIYIDQLSPAMGRFPKVGELLEVEGVTDPGEFAPQLHARRITRLGEAQLPPAIRPTWDQLINGSLDTQYVEMH